MVREPQTLGERLALVRNQHGITQAQVAQLLGVSRCEVTDYEQGQEVPLPVLVKCCDVFAVRWPWRVSGLGARAQHPASCGRSDSAALW